MEKSVEENAEVQPVEDQQTFGSLEDAMNAIGNTTETAEDTPEQTDEDQPAEQEPDDDNPEEVEVESEEQESESEPPQVVTLDTGEEVTLDELKNGYHRQSDYTKKTTALAEERKAVEEERAAYARDADSLRAAYDNLSNFLGSIIPPEPDLNLLQTDPNAYHYQQGMRERTMRELGEVLTSGQEASTAVDTAYAAELSRRKAEEETKLLKALPVLKDPEKRASFDKSIKDTATSFGFSADEIAMTNDSRILRLVFYAGLGKRAETNKKNATRRIAEKPRQGTRVKANSGKVSSSAERARKQFLKTGSIEDAAKLVFD